MVLGYPCLASQSGDQAAALIQKSGLRLFKGDTVLCQISLSLATIPGKFNIAHSIILAIPSRVARIRSGNHPHTTRRVHVTGCTPPSAIVTGTARKPGTRLKTRD